MEKRPEVENIPERLDEVLDISSIHHVDAGHMMYDKCIVETPTGNYFVKTSDDSLLTDPIQATRMWEYLIKEQYAYDVVSRYGFIHIPYASLHNRSLILEAHTEQDGWKWEAPKENDLQDNYVCDVLEALSKLERITAAKTLENIDPMTTPKRLLAEGWETIDTTLTTRISENLEVNKNRIHSHVLSGIEFILDLTSHKDLNKLINKLHRYTTKPTDVIAHFDARQSNIAWHPDKGVRIVDWSWASPGQPRSDTTMFITDLHKSNVPVEPYIREYFDPDHALLLMGYWLARSVEPSPTPDSTVRFHQLASAVTAASLLNNL